MEASKKRPHTDNDEPAVIKKRILSGANGSQVANGVHDEPEEPQDNSQLELFRKEAIFRRMKHYSREHERAQRRIAELEKHRNSCQLSLAAVAACWSQLVTSIRTLAQPEALPLMPNEQDEMFDISPFLWDAPSPDLKATLEESRQATAHLVSRFAQLNGGNYTRLSEENTNRLGEPQLLKGQVETLRAKLDACEAEKESLHEELVAALNRCDRLRSETVMAIEPRRRASVDTSEHEQAISERKPSPPASLPGPKQDKQGDVDVPLEAEIQRQTIVRLEGEKFKMQSEIRTLTVESHHPPLNVIMESPHYKILLEVAGKHELTIKKAQMEIVALRTELEEVTTTRKREANEVTLAQEVTELKAMLARRDNDINRIRETRDQQQVEINERKQRETVKMSSLNEFKTLLASQADRISVLDSQLKRCKVQLAARAGNEDLMKFLLRGRPEYEYTDDLRRRLEHAENQAAALDQALTKFRASDPNLAAHAQTEAEMLARISDLTAQLEKYQRLCGSSEAPDLMKQLEEKDNELKTLRLLDSLREQTEASLYAEIDKLSAAWEILEKQVKSKVFELVDVEERLAKSALDKAKSENKYYTSMREKEAIEAERKAMSRQVEKQSKAIEKLVESERNLIALQGNLEGQLLFQRKRYDAVQNLIVDTTVKADEHDLLIAASRDQATEMLNLIKVREKELEDLKTLALRDQNLALKMQKDLEMQLSTPKEKAPSTDPAPSGLQKEYDEAMALLKCGTCKRNFRNHVITKCMHTFCKECIEARISSRQRKCPHCSLAFAQSEVHLMYFQ
ncbi:hypothetical protein C8J56DRAFT_926412 [Mycena floridula]|nr:hypothetical protein C8J56DRAFT_926412 [Mycena floridula]